jgi:RNA polymerase sigma factor (TIGR02999 family)
MTSVPLTNVTQLLLEWRGGNQQALDALMPVVYDELRRLAQHYMRGERPEHTLQATALVNEAYLRLVDMKVSWQDRAHFFAVAARLMRRMLVDHARAQHRAKREGGPKVSLDDALEVSCKPASDLLALDEALEELATFDQRKSEIIELHFFGGLSNDEVAEALGISRATVQRELRMAKAWLNHELKKSEEGKVKREK